MLFVVGFVFLFFVPGYAFFRKRGEELDELLIKCFLLSSAVVLCESFLLAMTVGLDFVSLLVCAGLSVGVLYKL